ncbi:MAG: ribonuclease HII [Rhizobiaceae bacterium]
MSPRSDADSLALFEAVDGPHFEFEMALQRRGHALVAGIDEAGRGPLAGPVVAAAVILDPGAIPPGLNDSKKLNEARREALFDAIVATSQIGWAAVSARTIDVINIRQATLAAMTRAVRALPQVPSRALIDGRDVPMELRDSGTAIVRGDAICLSISAASIVAKVVRDRMMARSARAFPQYGFDEHAGYGTRKHLEAIGKHGPCAIHRMSFSPLRK